jgi:hypothetical protein
MSKHNYTNEMLLLDTHDILYDPSAHSSKCALQLALVVKAII